MKRFRRQMLTPEQSKIVKLDVDDILQAPTQAQLDCPYCHGKQSNWASNLHPMPDYDTPDELYGLSIERVGKDICFDADYPDSGDIITLKIEYCPKCGRNWEMSK